MRHARARLEKATVLREIVVVLVLASPSGVVLECEHVFFMSHALIFCAQAQGVKYELAACLARNRLKRGDKGVYDPLVIRTTRRRGPCARPCPYRERASDVFRS